MRNSVLFILCFFLFFFSSSFFINKMLFHSFFPISFPSRFNSSFLRPLSSPFPSLSFFFLFSNQGPKDSGPIVIVSSVLCFLFVLVSFFFLFFLVFMIFWLFLFSSFLYYFVCYCSKMMTWNHEHLKNLNAWCPVIIPFLASCGTFLFLVLFFSIFITFHSLSFFSLFFFFKSSFPLNICR